jgi:DNA adenine methylase
MVKPFLRWAGGKQNIISELLKHLPKHNLINKYYEPFLGAGSLFFANVFENAFISDINSQLINSYLALRDNHIEVHKLICFFEASFHHEESFYYSIRNQFNKNIFKYNTPQAARFIFLLHTNYNGIYRLNKTGIYNVPIGKRVPVLPTLSHLKLISDKLKGVSIQTLNYEKILTLVVKNDFIYLDPPYPPVDWNNHLRQFTVNKFSKSDHERLSIFAKELTNIGCYVMISNSDNLMIRELYKNWEIIELKSKRSISCKKERRNISELIIKNY